MDHNNRTSTKEFIFLGYPNSTRFPALLFTMFLLIYFVVLFTNTLLILIIKVDQRLHTPMYFFILNLSCLDIFYSSSIMPQTMFNLLSKTHSISFLGCATQMFCTVAFGIAQLSLMTSMAYDRYIAICNPLRYKNVMTWAVCIVLLIFTWSSCSFIAFIMVFSVFKLPFCDLYEINHFFCDVGQVLHLSCAGIKIHEIVEFLTFIVALSFFFIHFILVLISYIYILSAIMKIHTNHDRLKAFSTCSSHITVVALEYSCVAFIYLRPKEAYSLDKDRVFAMSFIFGTHVLNPLIYSARNKAVKSGFGKLISYNVNSKQK